MLSEKQRGALVSMRSDACIEDVIPTLADPIEFVRGIVGNFMHEKFNVTTALPIPDGASFIGNPYARRSVFHGRSHRPILEDQFKGISWSSVGMKFSEVLAILGSLRSNYRTH
jgi:hypothetical protein